MHYGLVREELCLVRDVAAPMETSPGERGQSLDEVEELDGSGEDLRWLWDRCASEWGAATIRDAAWFHWRFLERPGIDYTLLGVRRDGILRGVAVLRETPWSWEGALPVCDWLVPRDEVQVAALLEEALRHRAASAGCRRLVTIFPSSSHAFELFQDMGWRVTPTPYRLVARAYERTIDLDWLRESWWYTLADSDLA